MAINSKIQIYILFVILFNYSQATKGLNLELIDKLMTSPVESREWLQYSKQYSAVSTHALETDWLFDISQIKLLSDDPFDVIQEDFFDRSGFKLNLLGISSPRRLYIKNYFRSGFFEKAIIHLQNEEREQPDNLYLLMNMAYAYENIGDFKAAFSRISAVIDKSFERDTQIEAYKWRIRISKKLRDYDEAEKDLISLRKLVQEKLISAARSTSIKDSKAVDFASKVRLLTSKQELAETENYLGIIWYLQKKFVLAFDLFEKLESSFPGCYSFSFNKNKIYLEKRRYESTLKTINSVLFNIRQMADHFKKLTSNKIQSGDLDSAEGLTNTRGYFEGLISKLLTRKGEILYREKHWKKALKVFRLAVERDPKDSVAWYRIGLINVEEKSFDKAMIGFRKVLQNTSEKSGLHVSSLEWIDKIFSEQAVQAIKNQDAESKKRDEFFQNLTVDERQDLLDISELIKIGYQWLKTGKQRKLIRMFEPLLSENPSVLDIYFLLGRAYQALGNVDQAKYYYSRGLNIDSNHLPTIVALTYYDCVSKDFKSALQRIAKLELIAPEDHRVYGARGWYEYQKANYESAIGAFQLAIEQNPLHAEHHYRLGMSYLKASLPRFALHKFDDALSAGYEYSRADLFRAIALFKLGSFQEGENALKRAIDNGRDNSDIVEFAKHLLSKVKTTRSFTLRSKEVPEEFSDIALFLNRADSNRKMKISFTQIRKGKIDSIIKSFKNRIKEDPDNYELYHLLSVLYILVNREDLAMEVLEDVIALNPLYYPALNSSAELSFRYGRLDECVIYWERMKRVSPLIKLSDNIEKIISEMKRFLDINPQDQWALYNYALLQIHHFNDAEALKILESNRVSSNPRPSRYKELLIRMQAMILYRRGVLARDNKLINQARGLLELANYRYMENLDIYKIGTKALRPPILNVWKKIPVDQSHLDFLKNNKTKKIIPNLRNVPHPGIRRKPTFLSRWNQLDQILDKGNSAPIKSSYDVFKERRISTEQRYLENNKALYDRLQESNQKLALMNSEKADQSFSDAIEALKQGRFEKAEVKLLSAISSKVDFEEAYFGLLSIFLVKGEYSKMKPFLNLLQTFESSKELLALIKFHLFFHQGNFSMLQYEVKKLSRPIRIPKNRVIQELIKLYRDVMIKAPGDFEASLRYGILLQITGRFADAESIFLKAGQYGGLVPYICESLLARGMTERRQQPVITAVQRISEFSAVETKDKWLRLAQDLDNYLLTTRFLAQ